MKKTLFLLTILMTLAACRNNSKSGGEAAQNQTVASAENSAAVSVMYFHSQQRCPTCIAIENETKQLLDSVYGGDVNDKKLSFKSIDISEKENDALVKKYEVTWSSLFVTRRDENGKDSVVNLTDMAFSNARTRPDIFRAELKKVIDNLMADVK